MFPLLLLFLIPGGLYFAAKYAQSHGGAPLIPGDSGGAPPPALPQADAAAALNFQPFTLRPALPTTLVYIAPFGLSPDTAKAAIVKTFGVVDPNTLKVQKTRTGIVIPPPIPTVKPLMADLWTATCTNCGPPPGSPATTFSPQSVLQTILARKQQPAATGIPAATQLVNLLYSNAVGVNAGQAVAEFIPIGGHQLG